MSDIPLTTGSVKFVPQSTPSASGDGTVTYLDYTTTARIAANGGFTNICVGGFYECQFVGSKSITIMVPTNATTYQFTYVAQLATNAPVFSYPFVLGLISTYLVQGTNIVLYANNVGVVGGEQIVINGSQIPLSLVTNANNLTNWSRINTNITCVARGIATLSGGLATVPTSMAYATNIFFLARYNASGAAANVVSYSNIVAGVSFQIFSTGVADTQQVSWGIFLP